MGRRRAYDPSSPTPLPHARPIQRGQPSSIVPTTLTSRAKTSDKAHFPLARTAGSLYLPLTQGRGRSSGVEHNLAKVRVVSSNLIARSINNLIQGCRVHFSIRGTENPTRGPTAQLRGPGPLRSAKQRRALRWQNCTTTTDHPANPIARSIILPHAHIMSGLRKHFAALTFVILSPCVAIANASMLDVFASCTGRLSAQMEHQWLISDRGAGETERTRAEMSDILEALTAPEDAPRVLAIRINSKVAQAALLNRATFNQDDADAKWARRKAERDIATCTALILTDTSATPRQAVLKTPEMTPKEAPAQPTRLSQD